jgi:putative protease
LSGGFSEPVFFSLVDQAHGAGARVYLTLNTLLGGQELPSAMDWAFRAWQGGVDAIIVQDIGLARLLRHRYPDITLHASTQMSLHNAEGVLAAREAGISRVVLARELSIGEIADIREQTDTELEVFGHGALCVSYSGQCLMSSMIGGRSGNRGTCAQPCRLPGACGQRPAGKRPAGIC